jgi:DNA-binding Lrp family transcriptional regulator
MMSENEIQLTGIFSEGYGIIPKKLMRMEIGDVKIKTKTKVITVKGVNIKVVLAYMLSYTGGGYECFPGINTIAKDLEISTDTVVYAIKAAVDKGFIKKEAMYPNNPLKHNNKYILDFMKSDVPINDVREVRTTASEEPNSGFGTLEKNNNTINNNSINNNKALPEKKLPKHPDPRYDYKSIVFPKQLDIPAFKNKLAEYILYRQEIKKKVTVRSVKQLMNDCLSYPVDAAIEAINKAIANGWMGVFFDEKKKIVPRARPYSAPLPEKKYR